MQAMLCIVVGTRSRGTLRERGKYRALRKRDCSGCKVHEYFLLALTAEEVVEKWAAEYPVVQADIREYAWFKPLMELVQAFDGAGSSL